MLEWQAVEGGRARSVRLLDDEAVWVRVGDEGTVHFFTEVHGLEELVPATPAGDLNAFLDRLTALDTIDIVSRSLGGDDPGPMADG